MASFPCFKVVMIITFAITLILLRTSSASSPLTTDFYDKTCPKLFSTVKKVVEGAVNTEPRMAASLLRLHFHDCFVHGCDGSILLDGTSKFRGEKEALQNKNSVRGFDIIDTIKRAVEKVCPNMVSCADILAIAARDSVVKLQGPYWDLELGRRDSKAAYFDNTTDIPSPFSNLSVLISNFKSKGLSATDLVALSGGHTIGQAQCRSFKNRLYNEKNIDSDFKKELSTTCLKSSTKGDKNLSPLDKGSPDKFDNHYYANLVTKKGLLTSDQQLFSVEGPAAQHVRKYKTRQKDFFDDFAKGMTNMGRISPLTGKNNGEIRRDCKKVN